MPGGTRVSRSASKGLPGPPAPSAESPALLRTSKLVKVYRAEGVTVEAVRGVDIELAIGEFVAIMGPSGSGKSTLLHVLGGLEPATSGEIWLRGQRVATLSTAGWAILRRRQIGFVFQFFNLLSNMTVADNVELPALLAGATSRQARKRREALLAELGVADNAGGAGPGPPARRGAAARPAGPRARHRAERAPGRRADRQPGQLQHARRPATAAPRAQPGPGDPAGHARRPRGEPGRPADQPGRRDGGRRRQDRAQPAQHERRRRRPGAERL